MRTGSRSTHRRGTEGSLRCCRISSGGVDRRGIGGRLSGRSNGGRCRRGNLVAARRRLICRRSTSHGFRTGVGRVTLSGGGVARRIGRSIGGCLRSARRRVRGLGMAGGSSYRRAAREGSFSDCPDLLGVRCRTIGERRRRWCFSVFRDRVVGRRRGLSARRGRCGCRGGCGGVLRRCSAGPGTVVDRAEGSGDGGARDEPADAGAVHRKHRGSDDAGQCGGGQDTGWASDVMPAFGGGR